MENEILHQILSELKYLKQGQIETNKRLDTLEQDVQFVKNTVVTIEQVHGQKIQASLDGYTQLYDISNEIRQDVKNLNASQDNQDLQIVALSAAKR